jgi:glycosyltransferase involved in cell wall biosynthesis
MRVLFVSHTGLVGGAERSLLTLLAALPSRVQARLVCPPGPLQERAVQQRVSVVRIVGSVGSLKLHPVHTPVAVTAMAGASAGVLRAAQAWDAEVLHANSIRAGVIAAPAAWALKRPLVLHVRDCLPPTPLTERLQSSLAVRSAAVIAISRHVARSFDPAGLAQDLRVIANPFDLDRLDPARIDRGRARARLGIPAGAPALALVGQITPWKGQEEAIRALAEIRSDHPRAILHLVGEPKFVARATRFDNHGYLRRLKELVAALGVDDRVRFLGEREDVPEILRACDVSLTPSWEEPFGRAVVEAMAMGCPVIATSSGGPAEIIEHGRDGLLVVPRQPARLAGAIHDLLSDEPRQQAMAAAGRRTAAAFGQDRHSEQVAELYREVLDAARTPARRGSA